MRRQPFIALMGMVLLALALLPLAGCADLRLANLRADLERAEARWQQAGIDDYAYTFQWLCFCPYERVRITVRGGSLERVETLPPAGPPLDPSRYGPVEELFAFLHDALAQRAFSIVVAYDPVTGVPTMASVDYLRYAVDDETGFVVEDFELQAVGQRR